MMVPQLLALFPHLVAVMEKSFDHLQVIQHFLFSQERRSPLDDISQLPDKLRTEACLPRKLLGAGGPVLIVETWFAGSPSFGYLFPAF